MISYAELGHEVASRYSKLNIKEKSPVTSIKRSRSRSIQKKMKKTLRRKNVIYTFVSIGEPLLWQSSVECENSGDLQGTQACLLMRSVAMHHHTYHTSVSQCW